MFKSVAIYTYASSGRAHLISGAMHAGALHQGLKSRQCKRFKGVVADIAVAYGWVSEEVFRAYENYVYIDLGYWERASRNGYHRLAINSWDTATNMLRGCPSDRFDALNIKILRSVDVSDRKTILIAGMSEKAARTHGYRAEAWENSTRDLVRKLCPEFEVVIRPKPTRRVQVRTTLQEDLARARVVLTHHSNVALDAALQGLPVYAVKGIGALLSGELTADSLRNARAVQLETRRALMYDAAYAQWNIEEMKNGHAWEYVKRCLS